MFKQAFSSVSVDSLQGAKDFYGKTLGLDVTETPMGLEVRHGGLFLFIYPKTDHQPASFTVLNFNVEDIAASMETLAGKGVRFERYDNENIRTDADGLFADGEMRIAWFKDPAGNVLSIIEESS